MTTISTQPASEIERSVPPNRELYAPPTKDAPVKSEKAMEANTPKADPERLKQALAESDISLNFRRDDDTGRLVVEMINNTTGEPVMQIPNEVSLRLSEMFSKVQGNLFEARV